MPALDVDEDAIHDVFVRHIAHESDPLYWPPDPPDGRWQHGGTGVAWYFADEPATAWAEWDRALAGTGLPPAHALPRDLWRWRVDLDHVALLDNDERLRRVGLPSPLPTAHQWPAFQAIDGEWAHQACPSTRARQARWRAQRTRSRTAQLSQVNHRRVTATSAGVRRSDAAWPAARDQLTQMYHQRELLEATVVSSLRGNGLCDPFFRLEMVVDVIALGTVLVLAGLAVLVIEAHVATGGLLGVAGVLAAAAGIGLIMAGLGAAPVVAVPVAVVVAAIGTAAIVIVAHKVIVARRQSFRVGPGALIGAPAVVRTWSKGQGQVAADGTLWSARVGEEWQDPPPAPGENVVVTKLDGLTVSIRRPFPQEVTPAWTPSSLSL